MAELISRIDPNDANKAALVVQDVQAAMNVDEDELPRTREALLSQGATHAFSLIAGWVRVGSAYEDLRGPLIKRLNEAESELTALIGRLREHERGGHLNDS
ncbi:hypothetical protein ACLBWP_03080 [Microbacterium sp. M1A1_1b]